MKINRRDFENIKILLRNEDITLGRFSNKKVAKGLISNGSILSDRISPKRTILKLKKRENIGILHNNFTIPKKNEIRIN